MADRTTPPPDEQPDDSREAGGRADHWREGSWYEQAKSDTARALEELVSRPSFGVLLARSAENVAALARIGSDVADLVLRNLRIAGRADVTRLARQLHRTEDQLERLLQEVEALRDEPPPSPPTASLHARWVGHDQFDVDLIADSYRAVPGAGIDWANKLMKPVTNYLTTPAGRHRGRGPHRPAGGNGPDSRPGLQPGRDPFLPAGRPHRSDGGLEGQA